VAEVNRQNVESEYTKRNGVVVLDEKFECKYGRRNHQNCRYIYQVLPCGCHIAKCQHFIKSTDGEISQTIEKNHGSGRCTIHKRLHKNEIEMMIKEGGVR